MNPRPRVGLAFAGMCLIWGSTFVALKTGLKGTPPLLGVALRHLLASMILFLIIYWRKLPIPLDRLARRQYVTVGLLDFSLSYCLTYYGTQYIYSHISALLWASIPITTAIAAHFALQNERLTVMKGLGILVGFGGVALIFRGYGFGASKNLVLGMSLVIGAVLAATWPAVYLKRRPRPPRQNPIVLTAVTTGIGGLATLLGSLVLESPSHMIWSPLNVGIIIFLAVFGTVLAWVSFFPTGDSSTSRYKNKRACNAWFCVDGATFFSTARYVRKVLISSFPMSAGWVLLRNRMNLLIY